MHDSGRDGQALDLEEAEVNGTRHATDKRKGSLDRVTRDGDLACPFIEGSPRKIADDALAPGIQHSIDDGVEGSISPVADHQVMTVFGGLLGQWKCFPAIFFQADVSFPACSGQDSDHLRHSDDSPS